MCPFAAAFCQLLSSHQRRPADELGRVLKQKLDKEHGCVSSDGLQMKGATTRLLYELDADLPEKAV